MTCSMAEWLSEEESLKKLSIETPCCISCIYETEDGYGGSEADANGYVIETCCTHWESLQRALDDGRLP